MTGKRFDYTRNAAILEGEELSLHNDRIVVPKALQNETMLPTHEGHQGIECCCSCANTIVC